MVDVLVLTELEVEKNPSSSVSETNKFEHTLVDSCGEMFIVFTSYLGETMKIRDREIYRMDFSRGVWEKRFIEWNCWDI